jgi:ribosomal protein L13
LVVTLYDKKNQMKWYWESSHYKKELGDYVLDRVFQYKHPDRIIPDDFGKLLESKNIEQQLAKIRAEQQNYR